jgi:uncharacterized membrane protein YdjX (TVP38/TMEM64 family)
LALKGERVTSSEDGRSRTGGNKRALARFLPLAVLIAAMIAVVATGAHRFLKLENLIAHRDYLQEFAAAHQAKAVALYMLVYIGVVGLSVPGAVFLTVFGGFLFGWLVGGIAAAVAASIGATIVFLIARTSVGDVLVRRAGPRLKRLAEGFREDALSYLLFLRLVPVFPFWLVNLAPAFLGVPLKTFVLGTSIGVVPNTFVFAFAGAGLDSVIDAQKAAKQACIAAGGSDCYMHLDLHALVTPKLLIALGMLGALALIPVLVRRYGRRLKPLDAGQPGP